MAKQFNFAVVVDREQIQPLIIGSNMKVVGNMSSARAAKELRDQMREAYEESVSGGSEYQSNPAYSSNVSLANFIVMRQAGGGYEVGAKKNQVVGHQYVSDILFYMDQGTGDVFGGDPWVFPLTGARANNSDTGFWVTRGQEPKEFMEVVARNFGLNQFNTTELQKTSLLVDAIGLNSNVKIRDSKRWEGDL